MDDEQILTVLLESWGNHPLGIKWNAVPLESIGRVFLCDARNEATMLIIETIGDQYGTVTALNSHTNEIGTICGCLIIPEGYSVQDAAGRLRFGYTLANDPHRKEPPGDAF